MPKKGLQFPLAHVDQKKFDENFDNICTCMFNNCKVHAALNGADHLPGHSEEVEEGESSPPYIPLDEGDLYGYGWGYEEPEVKFEPTELPNFGEMK